LVDVSWPSPENSVYINSEEFIYLLKNHGFSDCTIIHEYGHHLEKTISGPPGCSSDCDHTWCEGKNERFSWIEGFSDYLVYVVPRYTTLNKPGEHDLRCGSGSRDETYIETSPQCAAGVTAEGTVIAVLWDLVDDPSFYQPPIQENADTLSGYEKQVFGIFDSEQDTDEPTLCTFVTEGWLGSRLSLSQAEKNGMTKILSANGVVC